MRISNDTANGCNRPLTTNNLETFVLETLSCNCLAYRNRDKVPVTCLVACNSCSCIVHANSLYEPEIQKIPLCTHTQGTVPEPQKLWTSPQRVAAAPQDQSRPPNPSTQTVWSRQLNGLPRREGDSVEGCHAQARQQSTWPTV